MPKRVYKKIPKGKGKAPVKVIRKRTDLKKKPKSKPLTKADISRISAGMGENVSRPKRKVKKKKGSGKPSVHVVQTIKNRKKKIRKQVGK